MIENQFWAKKPYLDQQPPSVVEHCRAVAEASRAIWQSIAKELADALGVEPVRLEDSVLPLIQAASILHDMAKVNSAFQSMLRASHRSTERQPVRHEILACWLLSDPDFLGGWFSELRPREEIWPVIWAIAGHHLKMVDPGATSVDPRQPQQKLFSLENAPRAVSIPLWASRDLLTDAVVYLSPTKAIPVLPPLPEVYFVTTDDGDGSLQNRITEFASRSAIAWNKSKRNVELKRLTALLKALLIASDVAGSALISDVSKVATWLRNRITSEALQNVIDADLQGKKVRPFQKQVEAANKAAIVIAGCGNGKTTAAYLWAKTHAIGKKLWFTYPTTGTASAGFEDYLFSHKEIASALFHSRAQVDLEAMRTNGDMREGHDEEQARYESLSAWDQQAIVCTVDSVLGLLQTQRRPLFSFPAIATGAFVFDEIHSYDSRLFGGLLRFLKTFPGAPVLLMSASIPPQRLESLQKVIGQQASDVIRGDKVLENHQRYRLHKRDSEKACREEVKESLSAGKKVLWVCNTVGDAVKAARDARDWAGIDPQQIITYHSRFRYRDRVARQKQVICELAYQTEAGKRHLRAKPRGALVISTQVCEMSLDISADLLVTAECPLPALVQRLGRLNRYAENDDPWDCLVYPFSGDPYNERPELNETRGDFSLQMNATRKLVREFDGKPCRQCDLAAHLEAIFGEESFDEYSAWLDDGWITEPAPVRDGDSTITLIREEDLTEIESELGPEIAKPSRWTAAALVPWTIPMLLRRGFNPMRRVSVYPVATFGTVEYSELSDFGEGASWQKNTK